MMLSHGLPARDGASGSGQKGELDIWVVDRPLEQLAVHLEKGGPDRFGLSHHSADRPLKGITLYGALDSHE
jgi:hypothetical protein